MSDLTKYAKGKRMVREDLIKKLKEGSGAEYTAGTGIVIEDNEISVDEEVVALKDELPAEVEAITPTGEETTLEGLKIGDTSYKIGGGEKHLHSIVMTKVSSTSSDQVIYLNVLSDSDTPFTFATLLTYLADKGKVSCYGHFSSASISSQTGYYMTIYAIEYLNTTKFKTYMYRTLNDHDSVTGEISSDVNLSDTVF